MTGPVGLLGAIAGGAIAYAAPLPSEQKAAIVVGCAAMAMIAVDVTVYRKLRPAPPRRHPDWKRILLKLLGLYAILALGVALYWLLPLYADASYRGALQLGAAVLPWAALAAIPYFTIMDTRDDDPDDAYLSLGRLLTGSVPSEWNAISNLLRGWLVKGFFLPLMFGFVVADLDQIWGVTAWPAFPDFRTVYAHAYDWLYLVDVLVASVGYLTTIKLLDTHIRSAEPTVLGWVVCLACYPPFWGLVGEQYLSYDQDQVYWGEIFWNVPALYIVWGSVILTLVGVYVWATVSFGLRFSNLTHRGIITHGPYRWTKHPAYLAKNITWWMISMPFVAGTGDIGMAIRSCVLLAGVNALYFLRARTEERHLSADPVYRDYAAFIDRHGLFAVLRKATGRKAPAKA